MSIKKEVIGRSEVYTIYSSEMKERMKIYFQLTEKYNNCKKSCPIFDMDSEKECEELCNKVYDDYSQILADRYKEEPEKIDEVVERAPSFTKQKKPETNTLWYRIFG